MKRMLAFILIFCTVLGVAGCTSASANDDPAKEFTFTYNGTQISLRAAAAPIVAALGEPTSYTEETSCAFSGLDKTYCYGSFYMTTFPENGEDFIHSIWFADDSVSTEEGIRIGSSQADVEKAYGADSFNGANACILVKGNTKLTIALTDGAVRLIHYEALLD